MTTPTTPALPTPEQVQALYNDAEHRDLEVFRDPSNPDAWGISSMQTMNNFGVLDIPNHDKVLALELYEGDARLWAAAPALACAYLALHAQTEARAAEQAGIEAGLNGCVGTHNPYWFKPGCDEQRDAWERGNARVRQVVDAAYLSGAEAARTYAALAPAEARHE